MKYWCVLNIMLIFSCQPSKVTTSDVGTGEKGDLSKNNDLSKGDVSKDLNVSDSIDSKDLDESDAGLTSAFPNWMPTPVHFDQFSDFEPTEHISPDFLGSFTDPDTKREVWRLGGTGDEMESKVSNPDSWGDRSSQHYYSRTSPSNRTETYAISSGADKFNYAALWKINPTKELVAVLPIAPDKTEYHFSQRQMLWDKNQDNVFWFSANNTLYRSEIDFDTYKTKVEEYQQFPEYAYITIGHGESDFSDDGKRLVILGFKEHIENGVDGFSIPFEVDTKKMWPARNLGKEIDWVSVDPSGKYIVISAVLDGKLANYSTPFEAAPNDALLQIYNKMKHSDFVVDKKGEGWLVYADWRGIFAARIKDGKNKKIWPKSMSFETLGETSDENPPHATMSGHVSRVEKLPGVVLVFRHFDAGMYFVNIDYPEHTVYVGNARLGPRAPDGNDDQTDAEPWGITSQGEVTDYYREPRGSSSQSGERVFFTSDYRVWGKKKGDYKPGHPLRSFLNFIEVKK